MTKKKYIISNSGSPGTFVLCLSAKSHQTEVGQVKFSLYNHRSMSPIRLLVQNSSPEFLKYYEEHLSSDEFNVYTALDSEEALDLLRGQTIDVLIYALKEKPNYKNDWIKRARQYQPGITILAITEDSALSPAFEAFRSGVDNLIHHSDSNGGQLARAIEDSLYVRRQISNAHRMETLRPLFDVSEALVEETDPQRLSKLILHAVCDLLQCTNAGLYRQELGEQKIRLVESRGNPPGDDISQPDGGPVGRCDLWGIPLWVNSTGPGEQQLQDFVKKHHLASVMCVPIYYSFAHYVLLAGRSEGAAPFQESDLESFGILTRQCGVAMENARLYGELREHVRIFEQSQQALFQSEKMAALGRLMASVAHEVNNPLQSVQNCLYLARQKEIPVDQREVYLDRAQKEIERLNLTVKKMLGFYRPGLRERETVNVTELLTRVIDLLDHRLRQQNISLHYIPSLALPEITVVGDQIQQIFINLVLNAVDAMPEGGDIWIETLHKDEMVEISFEDTGPGVPEELRNRIFEPFYSTKEKGVGLGLALTYGILQAHGGSIEYSPGEQGGAGFRVRIPIGIS